MKPVTRDEFVSVPLPGFSGLRLSTNREDLFGEIYSFSPVAGIQWVETFCLLVGRGAVQVSVPLPGFSGLRLQSIIDEQEALIPMFQSRCRDSVG